MVIGAGVAGLWVAVALREVGMDVVVLDQSTAGSGASHRNAGWICPAQAGPLPEPGKITYGLKDIAKRNAALSFTLPAMVRLAPWIAQFASYCNQDDYDRGVAALGPLGFDSFRLIEQLGLDEHVDRTGLLTVSSSHEEVEEFLAKIAPLAAFGQGLPHEVVTGDAVQDIDPIVPRGHSALLTGNHWQIIPRDFNSALLDKVHGMGIEVREKQRVISFEVTRGHVAAVRTDRGSLSADHVVIAAGAATSAVARQLGHAVPIVGGKGYSVDVSPGRIPRQAIQTLDTHVALSPMAGDVRIVGAMDFSNRPAHIVERRVNALRRSAAEILGPWRDETPAWAGLRPMAPDGLPILGRITPDSNAFIASGYSMLGMTISPAAGALLAEQIVSGDDGTAGPFSVQRFTKCRKRSVRQST